MSKRIKISVSLILMLTLVSSAVTFTKAESDERELYYNDDFIYEVLSDKTITIHCYIGTDSEVTVPGFIDDLPVVSVESLAFYGTNVKEVNISEGITTLKDEAFFYSSLLESAKLPTTIKTVGQGVFRDCVNLKNVTFAEDKGVLGKYMFYGCTRFETVNIPMNSENIPVGAFSYCQSLKNVRLPENLKDIYDYAFYGSGLESITLPKNLENIHTRAFAESKVLAEISGADREFLYVAEDAFYNCIAKFPYFKETTVATTFPTESSSAFITSTAPTETTQVTSINTDPTEPSHFIPPPPIEPTNDGPQASAGIEDVPPSSGWDDFTSISTDPTETSTATIIPTTTSEPPVTTTEITTTAEPTNPQDIITDDGYFIGQSDGFLIHEGSKISSAKSLANNKREELLSLAWNVRSLGDANCDNKVNIKDATQIQRFIALIIDETAEDFSYKNADVNTDGKITIRDATIIQKFVAKIIDSLY